MQWNEGELDRIQREMDNKARALVDRILTGSTSKSVNQLTDELDRALRSAGFAKPDQAELTKIAQKHLAR